MKYEEMIARVQESAGIGDKKEAIRTIEVVLTAFSERLYRTHRRQLATQLPNGIKDYIYREIPDEQTYRGVERFTLEDLYQRVKGRLGVGFNDAIKRTKAVMAVLQEAVSSGEIEDALQELPDDFRTLFRESG